ncbi:MAG: hypothetical protein L0H81_05785 [Actinomyces sp.]|nr:hypothetical protein [Actinomyces sp.]
MGQLWMAVTYGALGALLLVQWALAVWGSGALARILRRMVARSGPTPNIRFLLLFFPTLGAAGLLFGAMMVPGLPTATIRVVSWFFLASVASTVAAVVWSLVERWPLPRFLHDQLGREVPGRDEGPG